ncbi:reticulon family protein, partial [Acinetobacter baumannii]
VLTRKYRIFQSQSLAFSPFSLASGKMPQEITTESLMSNLIETITDSVSKPKSEESSGLVTSQMNRLFGREKPIHHILGGGKSADVLLWRNKKTSASVLTSATIIWVVFVWLSYNFLTILGFILVLGMLVQFAWKSVSSIFNRSSTKVPRLVLPDEVFVNVGKLIGSEV